MVQFGFGQVCLVITETKTTTKMIAFLSVKLKLKRIFEHSCKKTKNFKS